MVAELSSLSEGNRPFFSIITCTFNSAEYIQETIESVERQRFENFEHIFVDGFSTDATSSIIKAYQARYPNKVVFHQLPAKGISNAMNVGVELARGEVILHLHGDDCLASDRVLGSVRSKFLTSKASIVVGNCMLTVGSTISYTWPNSSVRRTLLKLFFFPLMFYSNLIPHPSAYVMKSVFQRHGGFDEHYRVVMDYEFWLRVLRAEKIFLMDDFLSVYRFHPETVSSKQKDLGLIEIKKIRKKYNGDYMLAYAFFMLFLRPILVLRRLLKQKSRASVH